MSRQLVVHMLVKRASCMEQHATLFVAIPCKFVSVRTLADATFTATSLFFESRCQNIACWSEALCLCTKASMCALLTCTFLCDQVGGLTAASERDDANEIPLLCVSIQGKECQMTAQQVMEMPTQQFFALWDVSRTHTCLLAVGYRQSLLWPLALFCRFDRLSRLED